MKIFSPSVLLLVTCLLSACVTVAERNAEAEDACRAFLVAPATAPISKASTRDLESDAIAEKWCKQVLEDPDLPAQIRSTVMEGLLHLMMEQTRRGLVDRKAEAFAMHKELVMHFPEVARFLLQART